MILVSFEIFWSLLTTSHFLGVDINEDDLFLPWTKEIVRVSLLVGSILYLTTNLILNTSSILSIFAFGYRCGINLAKQ